MEKNYFFDFSNTVNETENFQNQLAISIQEKNNETRRELGKHTVYLAANVDVVGMSHHSIDTCATVRLPDP